jgi:hypothetical protein
VNQFTFARHGACYPLSAGGFQGPSDRRRRDTIFRARRRNFLRPSLLCPTLPTGNGEPPSVAGCAFWPIGAGASWLDLAFVGGMIVAL